MNFLNSFRNFNLLKMYEEVPEIDEKNEQKKVELVSVTLYIFGMFCHMYVYDKKSIIIN